METQHREIEIVLVTGADQSAGVEWRFATMGDNGWAWIRHYRPRRRTRSGAFRGVASAAIARSPYFMGVFPGDGAQDRFDNLCATEYNVFTMLSMSSMSSMSEGLD
jgi:hypothetical protein